MSKKILTVLFLGVLVAGIILPEVILAQVGPADCCKLRRNVPEIEKCKDAKNKVVGPETPVACPWAVDIKTEDWGMCCLLGTVYYVTDWIFLFLVLIAVIMLVIGGFIMVIAMGDVEKLTTGRNYIMLAIAGLVLALVARVIPAVVRAIIGL